MPIDLTIAQAVVTADPTGPGVIARSDSFPPAWDDTVTAIVTRFGARPAGVRVLAALFAAPFGRGHVAVVQVADLPRSESLGFRFLVLNRRLYEAIGDPFAVADRFPPDWSNRGPLADLHWPPEPNPPRTIDHVAGVLKAGDSPFLLGATQCLLDGGRVVLKRDGPDDAAVRAVWQLLPTRSRLEVWPATFAFDLGLGFHLAVMPNPPAPLPPGHLGEEQAKDYPEGRYELALQTAADHGDQAAFDRLLARRSSGDTLKLALVMLAAAVIGTLLMKVVM
jgi:hypothetical protein